MNYFKDWTRLKYGRNPEEKVGYLWSLNERIKDLKKSFKEGFVLFSTDHGPTEIEYDEEDTHIEETSENHYIIDGMTLLEDLEEKFGIDFREKEFETINGFLIAKLDKIQDENDELSVLVDGYCFQIHKVENHRIKEVLVYKTQPNENGKEIIQEN